MRRTTILVVGIIFSLMFLVSTASATIGLHTLYYPDMDGLEAGDLFMYGPMIELNPLLNLRMRGMLLSTELLSGKSGGINRLGGDVLLRFPRLGLGLAPYVGAGLAYFSESDKGGFPAFGDLFDDASSAYELVGGIEFFLQGPFKLIFEARFSPSGDVELDNYGAVGAGVAFSF